MVSYLVIWKKFLCVHVVKTRFFTLSRKNLSQEKSQDFSKIKFQMNLAKFTISQGND